MGNDEQIKYVRTQPNGDIKTYLFPVTPFLTHSTLTRCL